MWIFIEFIITLITLPFVVKANDWGWFSCGIYVALCMMFTPIVGIPIYLLTRH